MKGIIGEVDALVAEMNALDKFNDDLFIEFYEKEEKMQERISALAEKGALTAAESKECSEKLAAAFDKLRGKLTFCNLK